MIQITKEIAERFAKNPPRTDHSEACCCLICYVRREAKEQSKDA